MLVSCDGFLNDEKKVENKLFFVSKTSDKPEATINIQTNFCFKHMRLLKPGFLLLGSSTSFQVYDLAKRTFLKLIQANPADTQPQNQLDAVMITTQSELQVA